MIRGGVVGGKPMQTSAFAFTYVDRSKFTVNPDTQGVSGLLMLIGPLISL